MSQPLLAISIERRDRHPYRSLYAEVLFQGFRDAFAGAGESSTTAQEVVENRSLQFPSPDGSLGREAERHGGSRGTLCNRN